MLSYPERRIAIVAGQGRAGQGRTGAGQGRAGSFRCRAGQGWKRQVQGWELQVQGWRLQVLAGLFPKTASSDCSGLEQDWAVH